MSRPARILIVDDSAVMRALLRSVVLTDSRLEVAGTASDGDSALRVIDTLQPDLVLLDVEMPGLDGLSTLKELKALHRRVPVIMCSALTQRGAAVTLEALASGAADYVAKPSGQPSREAAIESLAKDLIPKIVALTANAVGAPRTPTHVALKPVSTPGTQPGGLPFNAPSHATPAVVLIGVSTGGPAALDILLPAIPPNFPLPILVVQHMPELFTQMLAERLDARCHLPVTEAVSGEAILPGHIYIARGNWHMEVVKPDRPTSASPFLLRPTLHLNQNPPENHCRPAVDPLFRSAVAAYGSRILAVLLTGMGSDGLLGSQLVRQHHGQLISQDEPTSAVWGMPAAVAHAGLSQNILPIDSIAAEIVRLTRGDRRNSPLREAAELRESTV